MKFDICPLISIITVVYNGEKYLERTINSVLNQTYTNIEYIVIDGNSTDGTKNIIEKYEQEISLWISENDNGIYDAMNKGLRLMTGKYVWFMNAGDEIYSKETVKKIFFNYNNEDIFYGKTQNVFEDGKLGVITKIPKILTYQSMLHGMVISHQAIIIKKEISSPYNLKYKVVSDHDWIIQSLKKAKKIKNTNLILAKYLLGGFSSTSDILGWEERLHIIKINYGWVAWQLNLAYRLIHYTKNKLKFYLKVRT